MLTRHRTLLIVTIAIVLILLALAIALEPDAAHGLAPW